MTSRKSIPRTFLVNMMLVTVASIALLGTLWISQEYARFGEEARNMRNRLMAERKALIKDEAEEAIDYIKFVRSQSEARVSESLRQRVEEAHAIAQGLYEKYADTCSQDELKRLICDALRPIRFNGGRGYYFASDAVGVVTLHAEHPELEGKNLRDPADTGGVSFLDDVVDLRNSRGEGFYSYTWADPAHPDKKRKKISYLQRFAPFDWELSAAEYLDGVEEETQRKALQRIEQITFGDGNYVFVGTFDGVSLAGPSKGKDMSDATDAEGVKVVQELIACAQEGGGYVSYVMPELEGHEPKPKISYARAIPDWGWYLGTGIHVDDIEREVAEARKRMLTRVQWNVVRIAGILLGLFILTSLVALRISNRTKEAFSAFSESLQKATFESMPMQKTSGMNFPEFERLAESTNAMLLERLRLSTAVEQSAESIVITDDKGVIQYVNPTFERVTGYARDEVLGRHADFLRSGVQEDKHHESVWRALSKGEVWTGRFVNRRKDGALHHDEAIISPVRGPSGTVIAYVSVQRDITEEIRLENQLRHAQKMEAIGQMAGGVAHDFNNLLQAIRGYTEMALGEVPEDGRAHAHLTEVAAASDSAAVLVRQLLTFGRRETRQPRSLDLAGLVSNLLNMVRRIIGEHIELRICHPPSLDTISADPGQVEQILMNLCVNARDAMPDGGAITIRTENARLDAAYVEGHPWAKEGDYVLLAVSDTGVGMAPEVLERIFEPFFTTKEVGRGTGLGLATVYGIVKQHAGFIDAESEPGKGTAFNIYFPVDDSAVARDESHHAQGFPQGGDETILFAEDDGLVRRLAVQFLTKAGYGLMVAADGEEAIRILEENTDKIDICLLDVVMPKASGRAVARRVGELRPSIPILYASGYSFDETGDLALEPGCRELIQKPYAPTEIMRKLREMLDSQMRGPRTP